ncbi:MAG: M20 family metallopeptidase [Deltaproteobacteria bacterium]|nr:M20 family metallopeptidase [Deltaproteobacteria bacterium]
MTPQALKAEAARAIDAVSPDLIDLSRALHADPERSGQEHRASARLIASLRAHGFEVETPLAGLPTAFVAKVRGRRPGPAIGLVAEYDALPEVGHGCAHNLIAAGHLGAAVGVKEVLGALPGELWLFGTPSEEDGAGKVELVKASAFSSVDACLMFHPYTETILLRRDLALSEMEFTFFGRSAHSAVDPWRGRNALDGVLLTHAAVNSLRQYVKPEARIHGIVTHGGDSTNVVCERAATRFVIRAFDEAYLRELHQRVLDCARGAALASGTRLEALERERLPGTRFNRALEDVVRGNLLALGTPPRENASCYGSTDFGALSRCVPASWFFVGTHPEGTPWHSAEAAGLSVSERAHQGMLLGAKAIAWTAIDLLTSPELVAAVNAEFRQASS